MCSKFTFLTLGLSSIIFQAYLINCLGIDELHVVRPRPITITIGTFSLPSCLGTQLLCSVCTPCKRLALFTVGTYVASPGMYSSTARS
ncbi:hypothetical protein F5B20DRAFT_556676 [Whalleya microplaca]|nr:hypothetical protein F5B20DRAFT_556676 [Whalleya microplaca]